MIGLGQLQTVDIGKGPGQFAHVGFLLANATRIFHQLAQERHLQGLSASLFAQRAAYYLGEINALHPFREGNGRTQRMFFFLLARECGFTLDWTRAKAQEMIDASSISLLHADNHGFERIFLQIIAPSSP